MILCCVAVRVDKMESGDPAGSSHSNPSQLPCLEPLEVIDFLTNFEGSRKTEAGRSDSGFAHPAVGKKRDRDTWNVYDESTLGELAEEEIWNVRNLTERRKVGRVRRELAGKWVADRDVGKGCLQRLGTFDTEEEDIKELRAAAKLNIPDGNTLVSALAAKLEGKESHFTCFTALYSMGNMPQTFTLDCQLCQIVCSFE